MNVEQQMIKNSHKNMEEIVSIIVTETSSSTDRDDYMGK
jgi:hypothetical protein